MAYIERRIADIVYSMQKFIYETIISVSLHWPEKLYKNWRIHKSIYEQKEAEEFVALDPVLSATGKSMTKALKIRLFAEREKNGLLRP